MAVLVSLDELKAFLNYGTGSTDDDELTMTLDVAEEQVAEWVGTVGTGTVTETLTTSHEGVALLASAPVQSVTSVATSDGYVHDPADYTLRGDAGLIRDLPRGLTVTVVYVAGRASVPTSIRLAVLHLAAHQWETQRGPAPSPLAPEQPAVPSGAYHYARARQLLEPYLLPTGIG